jgi:Outer membrane protein and related peptidoglycan-associated (lipo)proteins
MRTNMVNDMKMTKMSTWATALALMPCLAIAQTPKAFETAANNAFRAKDYYAAMQYYGKVLEMEPHRMDISYRYADAARQSGAFGRAEQWYEKTLLGEGGKDFPDVELQLASVKKQLGKYEEAIQIYEKYGVRKGQAAPNTLLDKAQEERMECEWAMEKIAAPDRSVQVKLLSDVFNTPQPDFGAAYHNGKIYYSSFRDMKWGDRHYPPRPIAKVMEVSGEGGEPVYAPFNAEKRHTAHAAFSSDGTSLVFNQCDFVGETEVRCELFFSYKQNNGQWSEPLMLPDNINVEGHTSTQPYVAASGDGYYWLYYVSDQPGGVGGLDLWRVRFSATGTFGKPENLRELNTPENDITPVFDPRNNTLYFSTKGRWTIGGYDIYRASSQNGKWKEPEHLDVPYNSSFDDAYFTPVSDDYAYLTSNRAGAKRLDEQCCYDLFKLEYLPLSLEALAYSKLSYKAIDNVVFSMEELSEPLPIVTHFSGDDNATAFDIRRNREYRIIANKELYHPDTVYVNTGVFPPDRHFVEKLYLVPEINFAVRTYHQWTKEPLADVRIRLIEVSGKEVASKSTGETGNEAKVDVSRRRWFKVIAEKEGFSPDTVIVTANDLKDLAAGETLVKHLFLAPASMGQYLPIALFFDNDQPDPRTLATTTQTGYDQAVDRYLQRRAAFIEAYSANLQGEEKKEAESRLARFFDEDVAGGQTKLETFADNLTLFLQSGASLNIMVKAFASPLAKPAYNLALTQRRVASVRNYFRRYENGIFEQYLRNGQLQISVLPLGESEADTIVSDDPRNKRLSVFSPEASKERRAEIIEVRIER